MKHPRPVLASPGHTQSRYSSFLYPKQPKFSDRPKSPNPNPTPALILTLESAILAKWLTLTSRSGMLSFVVVPFTNGSPMGMGKMTTFFHPYTSPLSVLYIFLDWHFTFSQNAILLLLDWYWAGSYADALYRSGSASPFEPYNFYCSRVHTFS